MDSDKLFSLYFHEMMTDEEFRQLEEFLEADPAHLEHYVRETMLQRSLHDLFSAQDIQQNLQLDPAEYGIFSDSMSDSTIWKALLQAERTSPAIEKEVPVDIESQPAKAPPTNMKKMSRFWPVLAVLSSVAALIIVIAGSIGHAWRNRVIAALGETAHAHWVQAPDGNEMRPGYYILQQGYAKVVFKRGAEVLLQAPCEIELHSPLRMTCILGSVTAEVPVRAKGFVVDTPSSRITDYGTAFGVAVDIEKHSDIHVFSGEVGVCFRIKGRLRRERMLKQGQNALVDLFAGVQIGKARRRAQEFVRVLPDGKQLGIPGKRLNLADVVGGGNGFGTGTLGGHDHSAVGTINPLTGQVDDPRHVEFLRSGPTKKPGDPYDFMALPGDNRYHSVTDLAYVDGVFVPDGSAGPCIISTHGHVFADCPDTDGYFHWHVVNGWRHRTLPFDERFGRNNEVLARMTCISLRANLGITFDLARIREDLAGKRIQRFRARAGVPYAYSAALDVTESFVDVWVLVDGVPAFTEREIQYPDMVEIHVPLDPEARFLTLVATDGGVTREGSEERPGKSDWCVFQDPVLEIGE